MLATKVQKYLFYYASKKKKNRELFGVKCEHGETGYNYWVAFHRLTW